MSRSLLDPAIIYFDAVRRFGSIREAARQLDVAPSAINRQIMKLEVALATPLFERWPDGMKLTPAGEIFAAHAIALLQEDARLLGDIDALRGIKRGKVTLAAAESLNAGFLPLLISRIAGNYPGLAIEVHTTGSTMIPRLVERGEVDVGLAFSLAPDPDLVQLAVGRFRMGALMRADHQLARETTITLSQCSSHRLVLPAAELSIHGLMERQLRRFRGRLDVLAAVGSPELAKSLVLHTGALAFQTRLGLEAEISAGTLVHVPLGGADQMITELGVYVRSGRALPVAVDAFVEEARDEVARLEAQEG